MIKLVYKNKFVYLNSDFKSVKYCKDRVFEVNKKYLLGHLYCKLLNDTGYTIKALEESLIKIPINVAQLIEKSFDQFIKKYDLKNYMAVDTLSYLNELFSEEVSSKINNQFPNFFKKITEDKITKNGSSKTSDIKNFSIDKFGTIKNSLIQNHFAHTQIANIDQSYIIDVNFILNIIESSAAGKILIYGNNLKKMTRTKLSNEPLEILRDRFLQILNLHINQIPSLDPEIYSEISSATEEKSMKKAKIISYALMRSTLSSKLYSFNIHNPTSKENFKNHFARS